MQKYTWAKIDPNHFWPDSPIAYLDLRFQKYQIVWKYIYFCWGEFPPFFCGEYVKCGRINEQGYRCFERKSSRHLTFRIRTQVKQ